MYINLIKSPLLSCSSYILFYDNNEIFNFLKHKGLIKNDKSRNTDFGGMLIQLREYLRDKVIDDDLRKDWNKVKREAFQLTEIRNKSAHASIMMADEVRRAQNDVKKLLNLL